MRGAPISLKRSLVAFFCRPGKIMGDITIEMLIMRSWRTREYVAALDCQRWVTTFTMKGSRHALEIRMPLPMKGIWRWLINHGTPLNKIDEQPDKHLMYITEKVQI